MSENIIIREATIEDRIALWKWRNEPIAQKIYKVSPTIQYKQHKRWFAESMESAAVILHIGVMETLRLGCIRYYLRSAGEFEVKVFIKPFYCGKGVGSHMLSKSIDLLRTTCEIQRVYSYINWVSPSSGALFEDAGFNVSRSDSTLSCEYIP